MEQEKFATNTEVLYPVLLIPKKCTTLETTCEATDDVFIELSITSADIEGNEMCLYSGFCNVKLIDSYDVNVHEVDSNSMADSNDSDQIQIVAETSNQNSYPQDTQSQVWIDPMRSPYVYNNYDERESKDKFSVYRHQTGSGHITVEQHNTYITQNVYNYSEPNHYSSAAEFEHKKFRKVQTNDTYQQKNSEPNNAYEDDEFECGVFLSQLSEEIINENETRAREEFRYVDLQSENDALKQLMSSDIQSLSKQHKTILFLGHDSQSGQTIQKIAVNDPFLECVGSNDIDHELVVENTNNKNPNQKKYQCDKCKQIFDQISTFKQHMGGNHRTIKAKRVSVSESKIKYICTECGKILKNQEKFKLHCLGHGDPELECNKCHKVFASKFTLRTHRKIHLRKHSCDYCTKKFAKIDNLIVHVANIHHIFMCQACDYTTKKYKDLQEHQKCHLSPRESTDTDSSISFDNGITHTNVVTKTNTPCPKVQVINPVNENYVTQEKIREANSIIAKVMSNKVFLLHAKKARKHKRYKKACDVCFKSFDRIGDLKRHLIEHVIRSTLAKNPVNKNGTLIMQCEVCRLETFSRVDKYKAHLREHAKLTLYQCTFCNKSFSDSSNFSKHKKVHGVRYFQCDLCQRKFNSKKMITQHMEYHKNNSPIPCFYCDKEFHFESMLNKHIKCAHTKQMAARFRCKFCHKYFKTLKEKWDHEWIIHNVRKMIVDCLICGSKFRKYSELKRHCHDTHELEIPSAKTLLVAND
ncbi:unnamed protein product [Parnassius apollo]|uniref:(apollo) hypothetical protein n=1 Tax=Parnassius apollo TaxID=110799 RepID=A0A8S3XUJ5_PARAO|nr:unnamed protein product [Parnassius apollo]